MLGGVTGRRPPATLVIVAAGSGERLGADRPKALVPVAGRPLFAWSLHDARRADRLGAVVIAAPPGREGEFEAWLSSSPPTEGGDRADSGSVATDDLEVTVVAGGASRSESVKLALAEVRTELVAVHDAARPLAGPGLFDRTLERLEGDPGLAGVIAAAPVTDTIKRASPPADHGDVLPVVSETLDRSELWAVQTPQAFRTEILREALEKADSLASATDDSMLVEALGHRVEVLPAAAANFKVTTPEDLARAEAILGGNVRTDAYRLPRPSPS